MWYINEAKWLFSINHINISFSMHRHIIYTGIRDTNTYYLVGSDFVKCNEWSVISDHNIKLFCVEHKSFGLPFILTWFISFFVSLKSFSISVSMCKSQNCARSLTATFGRKKRNHSLCNCVCLCANYSLIYHEKDTRGPWNIKAWFASKSAIFKTRIRINAIRIDIEKKTHSKFKPFLIIIPSQTPKLVKICKIRWYSLHVRKLDLPPSVCVRSLFDDFSVGLPTKACKLASEAQSFRPQGQIKQEEKGDGQIFVMLAKKIDEFDMSLHHLAIPSCILMGKGCFCFALYIKSVVTLRVLQQKCTNLGKFPKPILAWKQIHVRSPPLLCLS